MRRRSRATSARSTSASSTRSTNLGLKWASCSGRQEEEEGQARPDRPTGTAGTTGSAGPRSDDIHHNSLPGTTNGTVATLSNGLTVIGTCTNGPANVVVNVKTTSGSSTLQASGTATNAAGVFRADVDGGNSIGPYRTRRQADLGVIARDSAVGSFDAHRRARGIRTAVQVLGTSAPSSRPKSGLETMLPWATLPPEKTRKPGPRGPFGSSGGGIQTGGLRVMRCLRAVTRPGQSTLREDPRYGLVDRRVCGIEDRITHGSADDVTNLTDVPRDHQSDSVRLQLSRQLVEDRRRSRR